MENNVVSLFNRRRAQEKAGGQALTAHSSQAVQARPEEAPGAVPGDFASIAERNRQIQEKLRRERDQANKAVLKSYRIK